MTWRNIVLGQRDNPLGMGSTVPLGTVPLVVIVIAAIVVKQWGHISLIFQDISMKLGGHMGHGPNSSYHDV